MEAYIFLLTPLAHTSIYRSTRKMDCFYLGINAIFLCHYTMNVNSAHKYIHKDTLFL